MIDCRFSRNQRDALGGRFSITNCQFGVSNSLNDAGRTDVTEEVVASAASEAVEGKASGASEAAEGEESDTSKLATFLSNGNKIIIIVGIAIMLLTVIYAVMRFRRRKK